MSNKVLYDNYQKDWCNPRVNKLRYYQQYEDFVNNAVTQQTTIYTAVTLNQPRGVITTQNVSTGASFGATGTHNVFTVNNTSCKADSVVSAEILNYSGTIGSNGIPILQVSDIQDNSFKLNLTNAGTTALTSSANFKLFFEVYGDSSNF